MVYDKNKTLILWKKNKFFTKKGVVFFLMNATDCITVMGETHMHVLEIIHQAHDTHFGMSVEDIIQHVAAKYEFTNLHQLALKTVLGVQIKRDAFLQFKNRPVVHLFTLKGKSDAKSN